MDAQYTGQKIALLRKEKGWTQADIAKHLNVSSAAVSKWERGLNFPDLTQVEPLSELLGIPAAELLGIADEKPEQVLQDITEIFVREKTALRKSVQLRIGLVITAALLTLAAVVTAAVFGRVPNGLLPVASLFGSGLLLAPLLIGLTAWFLGALSILAGRDAASHRWKAYCAGSLACCATALYFPILIMDLYVRQEHWATIADTVWGYHFASIVLLLGTFFLVFCTCILRQGKK